MSHPATSLARGAAALEEWARGFETLMAVVDDGALDGLDDLELVAFMQRFEQVRNQMATLDHALIAGCRTRSLADRLCTGTETRLLVQILRLSPAEAVRRLRAAKACGPRTTMLGERQEPLRPALAAAQRRGEVSVEQVAVIERALDGYDHPGFDPADVTRGERLLTQYAATFDPRELRRLADQVTAAINPDGSRPDDQLNADRRHFTLRPTRDGAYVGDFRLTGSLGAKLHAVLSPLTRPRTTMIEVPGQGVTTDVDRRSLPQRRHDALEDLCDRLLRSGTLPDSGGTPATVIVTMGIDELERRTGVGTTSDGATISVAELLRLAGQAEVVPTVLTRSGAVLDLGRSRRIASPAQTLALIARDGGCSFPGCAHPPELCERHHVKAWVLGGETTMGNLTLLCRYHHHNFAGRGWECAIDGDGLPQWRPPAWVDPTRRPQLNDRIRGRMLSRDPASRLELSG